MNIRQIPGLTFAVLAGIIGLDCGVVANAADAIPAKNGVPGQSEVAATETSTLNLGKQANVVEGELSGVAGYTKYATEVVGVGSNDWAQWGGSSLRNNTPEAKNIPIEWIVGDFDPDTRALKNENTKNIKQVAQLGSRSHGSPFVANGKVFVGTNNGAAYLKRYPAETDPSLRMRVGSTCEMIHSRASPCPQSRWAALTR